MATPAAHTRGNERSPRPSMPLLRLALAVVGATAITGAALAQSDGATPLPPQRPAVQEPAAQAPTPLPAAEAPAPDPGQQATMMPAPDVAPPPGIGQLDQIASSKALDPS